MIDLYGNCTSIELVDPRRAINNFSRGSNSSSSRSSFRSQTTTTTTTQRPWPNVPTHNIMPHTVALPPPSVSNHHQLNSGNTSPFDFTSFFFLNFNFNLQKLKYFDFTSFVNRIHHYYFNRPEDDIETVIAKKRQVVMNRRVVAKRTLSQDSNEELRLTMQNARDVLLSDTLPDKLIEEPSDDETIKENILKDLESEIHFSDVDDNDSNDESKPPVNRKNENNVFLKSGSIKSEYIKNIVKKSMENSDDDDDIIDDSVNEIMTKKSETENNEKVKTEDQPQPSTSATTSEEKSLFKCAAKKTNRRNYRKPK